MSKRPIRRRRASTPPGHRHGLSALGARSAEPPISWLMDQALAHPQLISLAAGFTDNPSLPVASTRELLDELLGDDGVARSSLQYGSTLGDPSLREQTAARILELDRRAAAESTGAAPRASAYDPNRTLITHGSQQLLYMLTEALCDPGDIALVEDPTYFVFLGMAQSHGLDCRGIRRTSAGIDVEHLEAVLRRLQREGRLPRVKLLYLVTYCQNPAGNTTTFATKAAALRMLRGFEKAAGHPIHVLEDAAYRDLRFSGMDVPSLLALPGAERRVIHTGTYSKPFATGIRVGYGLLPAHLAPIVARIKGNHDFGTAHLLQRILTRAIASGRFDAQVAALRQRYAAKARVMRESLTRHCADLLEWHEPAGGLYYWVRRKNGGRTGPRSGLFKAALANEVLYVPGALCHADDPTRPKPDSEMRLSFGSATGEQLNEGIIRLEQALRSGGR